MNIVLEECISKLRAYYNTIVDVEGKDDGSLGNNLANLCIREAINTRIDMLTDLYGGENVHTNATYACFCMEFVDSLVQVLDETAKEKDESAFGRAYKLRIRKFIDRFKPLRSWLQKTSS